MILCVFAVSYKGGFMQKRLFSKVCLVLIIVLLIANIFFMLERPAAADGNHQYKLVNVQNTLKTGSPEPLESIFNQYGAEGWTYKGELSGALVFEK